MIRFKTIFGGYVSARLLETQVTEAFICFSALDRMIHLGMPKSSKAAPFGKAA
jgi:hypothetical protein